VHICESLVSQQQPIIDGLKKAIRMDGKDSSEATTTDLNDLIFTRRVYIYHESEIRVQDVAKLTDLYAVASVASKPLFSCFSLPPVTARYHEAFASKSLKTCKIPLFYLVFGMSPDGYA
jgi:hypothetical protein